MTTQELALREAVDGAVAQFRSEALVEQVAILLEDEAQARRLLRIAANAVLANQELARADLRPTLIQATLKCAADKLQPDGVEAAFVIFGGREPKVAYMPMVGGLRKIAAEYGWSIYTAVVHEHDDIDPTFERRPHRARLGTDRGPIIGAYADARHKDGRREFEIMDVTEIEKVRATSRAKDSGPWKDWWERMAEKTVARRLFKKLPLDPNAREHIDRVIAATDLETGERIDLLYGSSGRPDERAPAPVADAPQSSAVPDQAGEATTAASPDPGSDVIDVEAEEIPFGEDEPPFDGEEPPPVPEEEPRAVFSTGRYANKTLDEVLGSGKDGLSYLRWAFKSWKTEPLRSALDRFAEAHPEIRS